MSTKIYFLDCPFVLKLFLQNVAKEQQSKFEGTYLLSGSKVNGHPQWDQEGESNAIWYDKNNHWIINDENFIGDAQGMLWNTDSTAPCPNSGIWLFWDWDTWNWVTPNTNDIIFSTSGNPLCTYLKFKYIDTI